MNAATVPTGPAGPTAPKPVGRDDRDDRDVRFAWACLFSAPVVFVLAFVLGYGLAALLGVDDGEMASAGAGILLLLMAAALFAVPTMLAWRFANRARARGDDRGRVPALVLTVIAVAFVGVNLIQWLMVIALDG
jgi:heme/copper-type cytochrome/quinol oxidase subunit 3